MYLTLAGDDSGRTFDGFANGKSATNDDLSRLSNGRVVDGKYRGITISGFIARRGYRAFDSMKEGQSEYGPDFRASKLGGKTVYDRSLPGLLRQIDNYMEDVEALSSRTTNQPVAFSNGRTASVEDLKRLSDGKVVKGKYRGVTIRGNMLDDANRVTQQPRFYAVDFYHGDAKANKYGVVSIDQRSLLTSVDLNDLLRKIDREYDYRIEDKYGSTSDADIDLSVLDQIDIPELPATQGPTPANIPQFSQPKKTNTNLLIGGGIAALVLGALLLD